MNVTGNPSSKSSLSAEFGCFFQHKRVLITGATGFVGYHLCEALLNLDADIYATALDGTLHTAIHSIPLIYINLRDTEALTSYVRSVKPDYVFHLASLVNTSKGIEFVLPTLQSNLLGTINLMLSLEKQPLQKLVVISSSEAPTSSEVPTSPYAASKLAVTAYASMFQSLYQLPISIARLFTCFGPLQPRNKLIPYIIDSLAKGIKPDISTPKKELDFIYVKDFVRGLLYTAKTNTSTGMTLDFGSGYGIPVEQMVESIRAILKMQPQLTANLPISDDKINPQIADTKRTLELSGWSPQWSLDQALSETIDWYRTN